MVYLRQTSKLNTSTAINLTNAELFGEKQGRSGATISFGSSNGLPKQSSTAFDAALAGVALTKQDTNTDLSYVLCYVISFM